MFVVEGKDGVNDVEVKKISLPQGNNFLSLIDMAPIHEIEKCTNSPCFTEDHVTCLPHTVSHSVSVVF